MSIVTVVDREPEYLAFRFEGYLDREFFLFLRKAIGREKNVGIHWIFDNCSLMNGETLFHSLILMINNTNVKVHLHDGLVYDIDKSTLTSLTNEKFNQLYRPKGGKE